MNITQQTLGDGVLKVMLDGSLDIDGSHVADSYFAGLAANTDRIIVDLAAVDYFGSPGIRVLVRAAKAFGERGGKLVVINAAETARRVMWTTGLDNIVTIANDEQTAIRAVAWTA